MRRCRTPVVAGASVLVALVAVATWPVDAAAQVANAAPRVHVDSAGNPAPLEPDPALTPGDRLQVTTRDICAPGYSRRVRDVPQSVKFEVYRRYGITRRQQGEYEVDHLVSLELGGSNSLKNLWPQSHWTWPYNARAKDRLENRLHVAVCAGAVPLVTAQQDIAADWIGAYRKYVGFSSYPKSSRRKDGSK